MTRHLYVGPLAAALLGAVASCSAPADTEDLGTGGEALTGARYLTAMGVGTEASANAYYASIVPGFSPGTYTLTRWLADFVPADADLAIGFYRNTNDLGFWREMYCTKTIARGQGGCFVVNWRDPSDRPAGRPNLGTVAMNVSPEGFTRFYAFGPNGVLSPSVALDSEGPKFVPQVCIVCHAGAGAPSNDQGSIFREFETALLQAPSGVGAATVEAQWRALNDAVVGANGAIWSEAEGALAGTDFSKSRVIDHVSRDLYGGSGSGSVALRAQALPASWDGPADARGLQAAKTALWRSVVAPSCMPCHRANGDYDWSDYATFARLGRRTNGAPSFLEKVTGQGAAKPMPQSELTARNFATASDARTALGSWLSLVNAP